MVISSLSPRMTALNQTLALVSQQHVADHHRRFGDEILPFRAHPPLTELIDHVASACRPRCGALSHRLPDPPRRSPARDDPASSRRAHHLVHSRTSEGTRAMNEPRIRRKLPAFEVLAELGRRDPAALQALGRLLTDDVIKHAPRRGVAPPPGGTEVPHRNGAAPVTGSVGGMRPPVEADASSRCRNCTPCSTSPTASGAPAPRVEEPCSASRARTKNPYNRSVPSRTSHREILQQLRPTPSDSAFRAATIANASSATRAARFTIRIPRSSPVVCRCTAIRCCCAGAPSSRARVYGRCPPDFSKTVKRAPKARFAKRCEEACANVSIEGLYAVFNLPHISQVYMFFRASLLDLDFKPGFESTDVRLFQEHEIPWDELAFPVVRDTLAALLQRPDERHLSGARRRHRLRPEEAPSPAPRARS